jgi:hypothetical protein
MTEYPLYRDGQIELQVFGARLGYGLAVLYGYLYPPSHGIFDHLAKLGEIIALRQAARQLDYAGDVADFAVQVISDDLNCVR